MMPPRMATAGRRIATTGYCLAAMSLSAGWVLQAAHAQSYPQRPIRIIVGFSAGAAGAPRAIIERMNREVAGMLELPDARERLAKMGYVPSGGSPDAFGVFIASEKARWANVNERARVRLD